MWDQIAHFGRKMVQTGLTHSSMGNISLRQGDRIVITRRGCMLDEIGPDDVVQVELDCPAGKIPASASSESLIHLAAYRGQPDTLAVLHGHSIYALAITGPKATELIVEGLTESPIGYRIPVVSGRSGSAELAELAGRCLQRSPVAIFHNHGIVAAGPDLPSAYRNLSLLEHGCRIAYLRGRIGSG